MCNSVTQALNFFFFLDKSVTLSSVSQTSTILWKWGNMWLCWHHRSQNLTSTQGFTATEKDTGLFSAHFSADEEGVQEDVQLELIETHCNDTPSAAFTVKSGTGFCKSPDFSLDEVPCQKDTQFMWFLIRMRAHMLSYEQEQTEAQDNSCDLHISTTRLLLCSIYLDSLTDHVPVQQVGIPIPAAAKPVLARLTIISSCQQYQLITTHYIVFCINKHYSNTSTDRSWNLMRHNETEVYINHRLLQGSRFL